MTRSLYLTFIFLFISIYTDAKNYEYDVEINGIYYKLVTKVKSAEVTCGEKVYTGDIVIPSSFEYNGVSYTVTTISELTPWMTENNQITSVIIPNTVHTIRDRAFNKCTKIESIILPDNLKTIEEWAFYGCTSLKSIPLPDSFTTIPKGMLSECTSLESYSIPEGVVKIEEYAFSGSGIKSVSIPNSLETINTSAFYNCNNLISVDLRPVKWIYSDAFYKCEKLSKINLGNNIILVGSTAFASCKEITDVYCNRSVPPIISNDTFKWSEIGYATLHVLETSISLYKKDKPWSDFGNIVALTEQDTGVSPVDTPAEKTVEKVFSLEGKYMDSPKKGINIIRMSDGTTKKVIIK